MRLKRVEQEKIDAVEIEHLVSFSYLQWLAGVRYGNTYLKDRHKVMLNGRLASDPLSQHSVVDEAKD